MKRNSFILLVILVNFSVCSCQRGKITSVYNSNSIIKTIGNIDIIVDPNVELMMILGRLANVPPFTKNMVLQTEYLDKVDSYFSQYDFEEAVILVKKSGLNYHKLPEYGMYLTEDDTKYIMPVSNKHFIISSGPAKNEGFYYFENHLKSIKEFRMKTNFDEFFRSNASYYEKMINLKLSYLQEKGLGAWITSFYGKKSKNNPCLYLTELGGNFGISFRNKKGDTIPHAVVNTNTNEVTFMGNCAHEFSHPKTMDIVEKLYKNHIIQEYFDNQYYQNASVFSSMGYGSGKYVLNETVNQACANKFLEKTYSKELMNQFNNYFTETLKMKDMVQIADFLSNYENNRKKYKTLNDFFPELEKFMVSIALD